MVSERECTRAWAAPFPIPFSRFNSLTKTHAKTRRDESIKTQKTKTKEERKNNLERERKKERSLSLSLSVWVVLHEEYIPDSGSSPLENASFFLSFFLSRERRITDEKFWREFFFFVVGVKNALAFFVVVFKKTKVFCTRDDFFFSLFLQPFWKNDTQHLRDSLLTVKKRVRERDSERERGSSFVNSSERPSRVRHLGSTAVPARFRDQVLFLNSVSSISLLSRVLSYVNFSTQLLLN